MGILKDLHLCQNFPELQKRAALDSKFRSTIATCERLAPLIEKTYDHASLKEKEGDEEEAFIHYMRCSELVSTVLPKSRNFAQYKSQKQSALKRSYDLCVKSMERSDKLAQSLKNRYELYEEMSHVDDRPLPDLEVPKSGKTESEESEPEVPTKIVDSITLEEWSQDPAKTILLLDFRTSKTSRVVTDKLARLTVLDVPSEAVAPGCTMKTLESNLPVKDRTSLRKISEADFVVLLDETGEGGEERGTPGRILLDAVFEYNQDRALKLKRKPVFLKGGFESWKLHFPSHVSRPENGWGSKMDFNQNSIDLTPAVSLVDYPDLEQFLKKAVVPQPEPIPESVPQPIIPLIPKPQEREPQPKQQEKPTLPSIPDRTLKPVQPKSKPAAVEVFHPVYPPDQVARKESPTPDQEPSRSSSDERIHDGGGETVPPITATLPIKPTPTFPVIDRSTKPIFNGDGVHVHSGMDDEPTQPPASSDPRSDIKEQIAAMPDVPSVPTSSIPPRHAKPKDSAPSPSVTPSTNGVQPPAEENSRKAEKPPEMLSSKPLPSVPDRNQKPQRMPAGPTERQLSVDKAYVSRAYEWMMKTVEGRKQGNEGLTGLRNTGNTCFMNSVLQILGKTLPLRDFFLNREYVAHLNLENSLGSHGVVASSFAAVLLLLWDCHRVFTPGFFLQAVGNSVDDFCDGRQHDAQEFCLNVVDLLHEDLNLVRNRVPIPEQDNDTRNMKRSYQIYFNHLQNFGRSRIYDIFQGTMVSTMMCKQCRYTTANFEPFTQIALALPNRRSTNLQSCLERHLEAEELSGDARWNCPRCRQRQDAIKKLSFWKLPAVMIIQLKRFGPGGYTKLDTDVSFPHGLNMREHLHPQSDASLTDFQLYGVTNHFGSLESGHYNANCRHPNGKWYTHDDETLRAVTDIKVSENMTS